MTRYKVRYNKFRKDYEIVDTKENRVVDVAGTATAAQRCCDGLNARLSGSY